ncbi:hypothetical protein CHU95_05610 [Niveispirillum lacus]|uniref:Sensor domain-containing diguanylate cyclase n=1 Tax=Niveispirillum lacus TaxID=1981099 RepID=A0A255Z4A7_9PROT|nr:EAL domain-containing protein [Niveispirillum lacus]OYQ36261.1 hypothetical protein CHU95_05610 [Niveispirillum lacus]
MRNPTMLTVLLLPPMLGVAIMALFAWLVLYPNLLAEVLEHERQMFAQSGGDTASEIADRFAHHDGPEMDAIDRAALRSRADLVVLVDADGKTIFANDVILEGGNLGAIAMVPASLRRAVADRTCGRGVVVAEADRLLAGCWTINADNRLLGGPEALAGHLLLVQRIDWAMSQARAELLNDSLRLAGGLLALLGLLVFLTVRLIVAPVSRLAGRLQQLGDNDEPVRLPRTGIRELRDFARVLNQTLMALRGRERELQAILNTAVDGVVTIDTDGTILQANQAAATLFGYSVNAMLGQSISMLMTDIDAGRHAGYINTYMDTGHARVIGRGREVVARRADGTTFLAFMSVGRLDLPTGLHFTALIRDVTAERQAKIEMHRLAHRDPDLDLLNRRSWERELTGMLAAAGEGTGFWVLLAYVRNLDDLAVTFGPQIETAIMGAVHRRVHSMLTGCELTARLARRQLAYAILSPQGEAPPYLMAALSASFRDGVDLGGLSTLPDVHFVVVPQAHRFPDHEALILAQDAGGSWAAQTADQRASTIFVYDDHVGRAIRERTAVAGDLPGAMAAGQLYPVFQPQIRLGDGSVRGVETLVRWRRPDGKPGPGPALFIPVAERIGLVGDIDRLVTRSTLHHLSAGRLNLPRNAVISINASVKELADPVWLDGLLEIVRNAGVPAGQLEIEVTETAVMENLDRTAGVLAHLRASGVKVAIDDFGAGYASLSYLKHLPADLIKIDQGFIRDLTDSRRSRHIVAAVINLAHDLEMEVVAEGVENANTAAILTEIGCDIGQGWHFGRPMEADALSSFMKERAG